MNYSESPIVTETNNKLTTKLNGSNWVPSEITSFIAFETIFINALGADGVNKLSFELPEKIPPGTYELNYFTKYKAIYTASNNTKYYAVRGNIEIISHNLVKSELEANFDVLMDAHEDMGESNFTEGNFLVVYE